MVRKRDPVLVLVKYWAGNTQKKDGRRFEGRGWFIGESMELVIPITGILVCILHVSEALSWQKLKWLQKTTMNQEKGILFMERIRVLLTIIEIGRASCRQEYESRSGKRHMKRRAKRTIQ